MKLDRCCKHTLVLYSLASPLSVRPRLEVLHLPMAKHHDTFTAACPAASARCPCRHTIALVFERPLTATVRNRTSLLPICRHASPFRGARKRRRRENFEQEEFVLQEDQKENTPPAGSHATPQVPIIGLVVLSAPVVPPIETRLMGNADNSAWEAATAGNQQYIASIRSNPDVLLSTAQVHVSCNIWAGGHCCAS